MRGARLPLVALSGHGQRPLTTSAFRGKADIKRHGDESTLMTQRTLRRPPQHKASLSAT
jgi:hypothetical protein